MNIFVIFCVLILVKLNAETVHGLGEIIYALNAGGESFTDSNGIRYRRDYLTVGTASDYGKSLDIKRVPQQDKPLYQTERFATESFGYNIPMPGSDGDYVLWLKFSEVWFNAANLKVFDVALNDAIVVKELDIYAKVGRGVAHDEVISFQVRQNKIIINGKAAPFNNEIRVEFLKEHRDNPKVNAIIVMKGTPDQVPQLPAYKPEKKFSEFEEDEDEPMLNDERSHDENEEEEYEDDDREEMIRKQQLRAAKKLREEAEAAMRNDEDVDVDEDNSRSAANKKKTSQATPATPKVVDPYASDETSYIIPILVAIGAFIPLLFIVCKL